MCKVNQNYARNIFISQSEFGLHTSGKHEMFLSQLSRTNLQGDSWNDLENLDSRRYFKLYSYFSGEAVDATQDCTKSFHRIIFRGTISFLSHLTMMNHSSIKRHLRDDPVLCLHITDNATKNQLWTASWYHGLRLRLSCWCYLDPPCSTQIHQN